MDPRTSETSYGDVSRGMLDTKSLYFGDSWLNPNFATYGNIHVGFTMASPSIVKPYLLLFMFRIAIRDNTHPSSTITSCTKPPIPTRLS